tara:strand:- start:2324 stop:2704 length:381 start_codon:yes stop_codon:yes gene_type:complete
MANEFSVTTSQEALLYRIWKGLTAGGIIPASPTNNTLGQGRQIVSSAGTSVALSTSVSCKSVTIQAEKNNTSDVIIGGSGVVGALLSREGIYLSPGDSVDFPIDDLSKIYIDALVSSEGVTYIYFN